LLNRPEQLKGPESLVEMNVATLEATMFILFLFDQKFNECAPSTDSV